MLRNGSRNGRVVETLSLLESNGAIHATTRVDLEGFLVGKNIELDTRPGTSETSDRWCALVAPIEGTVLVAVSKVAGICKPSQRVSTMLLIFDCEGTYHIQCSFRRSFQEGQDW